MWHHAISGPHSCHRPMIEANVKQFVELSGYELHDALQLTIATMVTVSEQRASQID